MSSEQNIKCGWIGCGHKFGTELDMNMHVMVNHMILLEHGSFTLSRQETKRKRPAAREESPEVSQQPVIRPAVEKVIRMEPVSIPQMVKEETKPEFRIPEPPVPFKMPRAEARPSGSALVPRLVPPIAIPQDLEIPIRSPWVSDVTEAIEGEHEGSRQSDHSETINSPLPLSEVIDEIMDRLRPMKQLGFIRPNRSFYCLVCLKYVRSYHECNWKHMPQEDRIAEMWFRRFGKERPNGKNQLMKELEEIREWIVAEETVNRDD